MEEKREKYFVNPMAGGRSKYHVCYNVTLSESRGVVISYSTIQLPAPYTTLDEAVEVASLLNLGLVKCEQCGKACYPVEVSGSACLRCGAAG